MFVRAGDMSRIRRSCKLSQKTLAVLAMIQNGFSDLTVIADAIGMPLAKVQTINEAQDAEIRRTAVQGVPKDFLYRIRRKLKCPSCGGKIFLVPCVGCQTQNA